MNEFENRISAIYKSDSDSKWPKLKRDHIGLRVKTIRELKNGYVKIPIGTLCTITYSHGGLNLETDECPCCKVKIFIRKVPYSYIELIG